MAQYHIKEDRESLVQCPFDNTHMIRICRMQYHIMKCNKNFRHIKYEPCPFNARHWKAKAEMPHHIANCPDKAIIEVDLIHEARQGNEGTYFHGDCSVPEYQTRTFDVEDDWDSELDTNRGTFQWGQSDPNEYFNSSRKMDIENGELPEDWKQRLPAKAARILQVTQTATIATSTPATNPLSMTGRLPKTIPAAAVKLGGHGRGRGYGNPQQKVPPAVGSVNSHVMTNGFSSNGLTQKPADSVIEQERKPARGRGRGKNNTGPVQTPHLSILNDCDSSSVSSEASNSSQTRPRAGKKVNVPLFNPAQSVPAAPRSNPQAPVSNLATPDNLVPRAKPMQSSVPAVPLFMATAPSSSSSTVPPAVVLPMSLPVSYGLLGIGRGISRKTAHQNQKNPQFIVPKVGSSEEDSVDPKKQIRKLEKKLREIENIEEKKEQCGALNEDEVLKMQMKLGLMAQLDKLRIS